MNIKKLIHNVIICIIVMQVYACAPTGRVAHEKINLVWPHAPAKARIAYDYNFSNAEDLGIEKSFWQLFGEFFTGAEDVFMVRPTAVVRTSDNIIFVADPGVRGVHRFNLSDDEYDLIRLKDNEELPSPVALVSYRNGTVLVSDSQLGKIYKLTAEDEYAVEYKLNAQLKQPTGLAFDTSSNRLYVVDTIQHKVLIFKNGRLKSDFGKRGKKQGEFNFPTMIWSDHDSNILVTDSLNFRIQVFDDEGQYLTQFGQIGDASGNHARPKGLAADLEGRIYVVDSLFHNIQIFNSKGQFLLNIGEQGSQQGQFWLPTGIFIDDQKYIYVADSYNRRVQVFHYLGVDE